MEAILDALTDTGKLIPLLALVYVLVGFLEYRYGDRMGDFISRFGALGPVAGALFGCIPQCGFSVVAAALYARRLLSIGTLLAVFISTSDEAVPVLLSIPSKTGMVGLLIGLKVAIAVAAGVVVDLTIGRRMAAEGKAVSGEAHVSGEHARCGCCSHGVAGKRSLLKAVVIHPFLHTVKIFVFLFVLAALFNFLIGAIGQGRIGSVLLQGSIFQPVLAALIGLIPSCFVSVLLAGLFIKGVLSFGALVAGLCAGCGLGLLVLIKENSDRADTLRVIGLLLGVSILAGVILSVTHI